MFMKKTFLVKEDYINTRLDRWFRRNISEVPQSLIEKNIRKGNIKVNNKKEKSSYKLKNIDEIIKNRGDYNIKGVKCPFRDRAIEENLKLFKKL